MRIRDLAAALATALAALALVTTAEAGGKPKGKGGKKGPAAAPRPAPRFSLQPLEGAAPVAIGNGGHIGLFTYGPGAGGQQIMTAIAWAAGKATPLESPDGQMSQIHDVHPDGTMVGMAAHHAVIWRGGKLIDLTPGMLWAEARAINASGVVVGNFRRTSADVDKCFQWSGGNFIELPLPGCSDINASGQVLGGGQIWSTKGVIKLQQPPGIERFGAMYINDDGIVAGTVFMGLRGGGDRAFVWSKDGKTATLLHDQAGEVRGINAKGQIIGRTGVRDDLGAVMWEGGKMLALEDLIAERDWHLTDVLGINDQGQIVGTAYVGKGSNDKRKERSFLLTPLP